MIGENLKIYQPHKEFLPNEKCVKKGILGADRVALRGRIMEYVKSASGTAVPVDIAQAVEDPRKDPSGPTPPTALGTSGAGTSNGTTTASPPSANSENVDMQGVDSQRAKRNLDEAFQNAAHDEQALDDAAVGMEDVTVVRESVCG